MKMNVIMAGITTKLILIGVAQVRCLTSSPLFHIDTVHSKLVGALNLFCTHVLQQAASAERC